MQSLYSFRKPDVAKTLGVEWEVFFQDEVPLLGSYYGFFYATDDGSLCRPSWAWTGCEMVSQPLPATWLCKELGRLAKKFPTRESNDSCGVHVHASRKWATKVRVNNIKKVLDTLTKDEYRELFGRAPNNYCRHPSEYDRVYEARRYWYINTTNSNTVEFRMFASSADVKWVQYCVRMAEYLLTHAKHLNKEALFAFCDMAKP
jgi:hypothetical protein